MDHPLPKSCASGLTLASKREISISLMSFRVNTLSELGETMSVCVAHIIYTLLVTSSRGIKNAHYYKASKSTWNGWGEKWITNREMCNLFIFRFVTLYKFARTLITLRKDKTYTNTKIKFFWLGQCHLIFRCLLAKHGLVLIKSYT